jgi:hypothetical protein
MYTDRILKQALKCRPKGKRNVGRPRKRWKDQLHLEGSRRGTTPNTSQIMMMIIIMGFRYCESAAET